MPQCAPDGLCSFARRAKPEGRAGSPGGFVKPSPTVLADGPGEADAFAWATARTASVAEPETRQFRALRQNPWWSWRGVVGGAWEDAGPIKPSIAESFPASAAHERRLQPLLCRDFGLD